MGVAAATKVKKVKAPKIKKPKPMSKEKKSSLIDGKIEELMVARTRHGSACVEWEAAHAKAGELKKTMELRQAQVNGIVADIESIRNGNYTPPLPFKDDVDTKVENKATVDSPGDLAAWRAIKLEDVAKGDLLEKLDGDGMSTVGDYQDAMQANRKIKGVGPGKLAQLDDAILEYWKNHQELRQPVAEAEPEKAGKIPF